ncbi:MAG: hypothetical protein JSR89_18225 [Proteobacteria bacterium]|nr:hypothetical protein [Pseudomonadota bacterium]
MELSFATVELRSICENRRKAATVLGVVESNELLARVGDLMASETMGEFIDLFPKEVVAYPPDEYLIQLKSGFGLRVVAGHLEIPRTESGATDWSQVSRIKIINLEPPHE